MPELERQRRILLGVLPDVHRRELPEFLLGMHAEVGSGVLQALLGLHLLQVIKAQRVQREAVAILVNERRGKHGVVYGTVDRKAGGL